MSEQDRPRGVQAVGCDGELYDLPEPERLPDQDGRRAWLVRVPAGLPVRVPLEVRVAVLPGRTELRVEWGAASGGPAAAG